MSNPFDRLMRDQVALVKKNGVRTENIKADVQKEKIITFDTKIDVEEGDYIERTLPNGRIERYLILDIGYQAGLHQHPGSYNMKFRKESDLVEQKSPSSIVYTINGPNARINISSTDASINISSVNESGLFDKMRESFMTSVKNETDLQAILKGIDLLQSEVGKRTFAECLFITDSVDGLIPG